MNFSSSRWFTIVLFTAGIITGLAFAVPWFNRFAQTQPETPDSCSCKSSGLLGNATTLYNCQCGTIQCVVAIHGNNVTPTLNLVCLK